MKHLMFSSAENYRNPSGREKKQNGFTKKMFYPPYSSKALPTEMFSIHPTVVKL